MNQGESIFKDSYEDSSYNTKHFKLDDEEKYNRKIKIIILCIVGTITFIIYFLFFFQLISTTSIGKLRVTKDNDKIAYVNNSQGYKEWLIVYGKPNKVSEAKIKIFYRDKEEDYRVTFSNRNSWGNGTITLYNDKDKIIYENKYSNNVVSLKGMWEDFSNHEIYEPSMITEFSIRSFDEFEEYEIINLVLRNNVRFRGNVYILFPVVILTIGLIYSIFYWEKAFERRMKWYTSETVTPSDTYEMRVWLSHMIGLVMIIVLLIGAFIW